MKNRKINVEFLVAIFLLVASCNRQTSEKEQLKQQSTESITTPKLDLPVQLFSLAYDQPVTSDSNTLLFFKQVPFDTSGFLHIKKVDSIIKGVYYQVDPAYHRNFNDFFADDKELFFFDGFSFKLDYPAWKKIKDHTKELLIPTADTSSSNSPCFDCAMYRIYFNNEARSGRNLNNLPPIKAYDRYLMNNLIDSLVNLKKRRI